jgi:hypothetical protein
MDNSLDQQESEKHKSSRLIATLQILESIENWLASIFELTQEELENAGVRLDDQR